MSPLRVRAITGQDVPQIRELCILAVLLDQAAQYEAGEFYPGTDCSELAPRRSGAVERAREMPC